MKDQKCYCCSDLEFSKCCQPVLNDHGKATSPEMLMRSRYTAYVVKDERHLLATWAPSTRPQSVALDKDQTKWLQLRIHDHTVDIGSGDTGEVDFQATFIAGDELCHMKERSRFICKKGFWYYLDGENSIEKKPINRKAVCPCGSGKKFKRCCLTG
ncbi:YchJ family protein [Desulfopila sp. IMCC35008]|uniref:YchJ family protein n=1 Tax=Desulfopila sp. IMCC35008 TaxID=2653858 RepID=UPI0013D3F8AE|nr:YchJ family metal-binding protein [Desulfopila sp. IMCC35008]